jgi:hypothetical protein
MKLFFSYSHTDAQLRDELDKHLAMLKRQGVIEAWHDRRILAGDAFDREISDELEEAGIVLLLVSADFLASTCCYDVEMTRALERHAAGEARVIPVILRPCDWRSAPFGHLVAVPQDGKPIVKWASQDEAFLDVVHAIRTVAAGEQSAKPSGNRAPNVSRPLAGLSDSAELVLSRVDDLLAQMQEEFRRLARDRAADTARVLEALGTAEDRLQGKQSDRGARLAEAWQEMRGLQTAALLRAADVVSGGATWFARPRPAVVAVDSAALISYGLAPFKEPSAPGLPLLSALCSGEWLAPSPSLVVTAPHLAEVGAFIRALRMTARGSPPATAGAVVRRLLRLFEENVVAACPRPTADASRIREITDDIFERLYRVHGAPNERMHAIYADAIALAHLQDLNRDDPDRAVFITDSKPLLRLAQERQDLRLPSILTPATVVVGEALRSRGSDVGRQAVDAAETVLGVDELMGRVKQSLRVGDLASLLREAPDLARVRQALGGLDGFVDDLENRVLDVVVRDWRRPFGGQLGSEGFALEREVLDRICQALIEHVERLEEAARPFRELSRSLTSKTPPDP